MMRFSHWIGPRHSWEDTLATARHVESTGWDGLWYADHFMPDGKGDAVMVSNLESWVTISALAASVARIRIGSLVTGNTYRNPALLAKMVATADQVSGGRITLGMGAGWQENEHRAYGFEFPPDAERRERLAESVRLIKELFSNTRTTFDGKYYNAVDAPFEPKPVQENLPVVIGGESKRLLRIVAETADGWNVWGGPEFFQEKSKQLDQICEEVGRDPASITRSAQSLIFTSDNPAVVEKLRKLTIPYPSIIGSADEVAEVLARYKGAGADEFIVPDFNFRSMEDGKATLDLLMGQVAPQLR